MTGGRESPRMTGRLLAAAATVACGGGAPEPAALDTRNEPCASCRMAVSRAVFASQLVAPGELPRFFDDLGCLADYLKAGRAPAGATAFVADLAASELKDRLAERGVMRLRLASRPDGLLEAVRALAPASLWAGESRGDSSGRDRELIVPGPAAVRPRVLDAVRALGVEVRGLTADEGRLDTLYRELVGEAESHSAHGKEGR